MRGRSGRGSEALTSAPPRSVDDRPIERRRPSGRATTTKAAPRPDRSGSTLNCWSKREWRGSVTLTSHMGQSKIGAVCDVRQPNHRRRHPRSSCPQRLPHRTQRGEPPKAKTIRRRPARRLTFETQNNIIKIDPCDRRQGWPASNRNTRPASNWNAWPASSEPAGPTRVPARRDRQEIVNPALPFTSATIPECNELLFIAQIAA